MDNNIKNFEDACSALGLDPETVIPDFSSFPEEDQKAMIPHSKLIIIAKALNGDWKPDWKDWSQRKYYPWFSMDGSSGSGFAYHDYGSWHSHSNVGSRLCFKSREMAEFAGKQFESLYLDYFVIS